MSISFIAFIVVAVIIVAVAAFRLGAHVSAVPNHQTGRTVPLKMRGDVALGGNFGFELDPGKLLPEELEEAKQMVSRVKSLRDLTRRGTFWRLLSPFEGQVTAWSFVSENRKEVLLCAYSALSVPNSAPTRVCLHGLIPEAGYKTEDGRLFSGAALMYHGITLPLRGDFSSIVLLLKAD